MAGGALSWALVGPEDSSPSSPLVERGAFLLILLGGGMGAGVTYLSIKGLNLKRHTWVSLATLSLTSYPPLVFVKTRLNQAFLGVREQLWNEFLVSNLIQRALWGKRRAPLAHSMGNIFILTLLAGALRVLV